MCSYVNSNIIILYRVLVRSTQPQVSNTTLFSLSSVEKCGKSSPTSVSSKDSLSCKDSLTSKDSSISSKESVCSKDSVTSKDSGCSEPRNGLMAFAEPPTAHEQVDGVEAPTYDVVVEDGAKTLAPGFRNI